jgi:hypothetical protein
VNFAFIATDPRSRCARTLKAVHRSTRGILLDENDLNGDDDVDRAVVYTASQIVRAHTRKHKTSSFINHTSIFDDRSYELVRSRNQRAPFTVYASRPSHSSARARYGHRLHEGRTHVSTIAGKPTLAKCS